MSEDNLYNLHEIIREVIDNNSELKFYINCLGSEKWSEFAKRTGAHRYEEQFDNGDFEEHFHYSPEEAQFDAEYKFVSDVSEKVLIMIEAYLKTFITIREQGNSLQ